MPRSDTVHRYYRATAELTASLDEQDIRRLLDLVTSFRRIIVDHAPAMRS